MAFDTSNSPESAKLTRMLSLPKELKLRADRLAAMAAAKAKIAARTQERYAHEKAEFDEKMSQRQARAQGTGKKPRGKTPKPPTPGAKDGDQINLTDEKSRIMPVAGGGFEQCYNAQAEVDADTMLVVATTLTQAPIVQCQQCHTHAEWLMFLRKIDRETSEDKTLNLIAENYATRKHPAVQEWLDKHRRFNTHFTPTSASWLNMVEGFFRDITTERLRRGVFTTVPEMEAGINEYVTHHNIDPKPFIRTKSARDILQKVIRANSNLSSK